MKNSNKLWDKGFSTDKKIDLFTVGNDRELDLILAKYDVIGNIAHAKMLHKIGLLTDVEIASLEAELKNILKSSIAKTEHLNADFDKYKYFKKILDFCEN